MNSMFLISGSVFASLIFVSVAVEFSNRWTVQINGDIGEAQRLAVKHGFVNQGKVKQNSEVLKTITTHEEASPVKLSAAYELFYGAHSQLATQVAVCSGEFSSRRIDTVVPPFFFD